VHGFPRATADLDLTIDLAERDPQRFVTTLRRAGFLPRFDDHAFIAETRVIPVVHRASHLPIDLVLAGPGLEQRFLDEVVIHRIDGRDIPVLSVENLVVTKLLAARPKDLDDVKQLLAINELDHPRVEATLAEIEAALGHSDLRPLYRSLRRS
jgi:hypothetical protein